MNYLESTFPREEKVKNPCAEYGSRSVRNLFRSLVMLVVI